MRMSDEQHASTSHMSGKLHSVQEHFPSERQSQRPHTAANFDTVYLIQAYDVKHMKLKKKGHNADTSKSNQAEHSEDSGGGNNNDRPATTTVKLPKLRPTTI